MDITFSLKVSVAISGMVLLLSMSSIGDANDSFAKKYTKNQAATQANSCGNTEIPEGDTISGSGGIVGTNSCQNIDAQIQGDDNSVALAGVHHDAS
jgi:hypothetical protein